VKRDDHTFQFSAAVIAGAAQAEAKYHEERLAYWEAEYEASIQTVEATIGAKVVRRDVTGGQQVDVVVDYGDAEAWAQTQRAFGKIRAHRDAAERFRTDERVYRTQGDRTYELDTDDVHHFRLGGQPRED
jgi:hypothetical protein